MMKENLTPDEQRIFSMVLLAKQLHNIEALVNSAYFKSIQLGVRDDNLERQGANLKDMARDYNSRARKLAERLGVDYQRVESFVYDNHTGI